MLDAFGHLLGFKLCRHNRPVPMPFTVRTMHSSWSVTNDGGDFIPLVCESFGVWSPWFVSEVGSEAIVAKVISDFMEIQCQNGPHVLCLEDTKDFV